MTFKTMVSSFLGLSDALMLFTFLTEIDSFSGIFNLCPLHLLVPILTLSFLKQLLISSQPSHNFGPTCDQHSFKMFQICFQHKHKLLFYLSADTLCPQYRKGLLSWRYPICTTVSMPAPIVT